MSTSQSTPANKVHAFIRSTHMFIGFNKGYNFALFFIFGGALVGFCLARLMYLNFTGVFCARGAGANGAAPGECYYYEQNRYKIGIMLHLAGVLPAGLLAVLQFVPIVRYRAILFHRINGYVVVLLALVGTAGALMIARVSFGGGIDIQAAVGFLAIITTASLVISYINIKRLQIDQHRAWMLRAWFYFATIITVRIIMIIAAQIITLDGGFFAARPCAQIAYIYNNSAEQTLELYPDCAAYFDGTDPSQQVVVQGSFNSRPEQIAASMGIPFGIAIWLAIALHAIGVEVYLNLTPRESERLRIVSYERQLAAGFKFPGSAGLTADRLGDADLWQPPMQPKVDEERSLNKPVDS